MPLTNPESADHIAAEAGTFEPQRQNNFTFEVALSSEDKDVITLSMQSAPLPNESNDEVEIQHQNERRYVAGQALFEATTLTIRDYVDQDTRGALLRWRKLVYNPKTGKVGLAKDYKKRAFVRMTAPDGTSERICKLIGSWPQALVGGNLSHDASEQVLIEVTIRFDKVDWSDSISGLT